MKRPLNAILHLTVSVVMLTAVAPVQALAQQAKDNESITLSPALIKLTLTPGQRYTGNLTVINDGKTAYPIIVYARPYSVQGEQYTPDFERVTPSTDAYQWLTFPQASYELQPGQRLDAAYAIDVPSDASPGGHYAVLFAETQPPLTQGSGVARKKRVGSLLYITVSGPANQAGSVLSWDVPRWQTKRPLTATLRMKNSGNVHYTAAVQVSFTDSFGRRYQTEKSYIILPGTVRRIPVDWLSPPAAGLFKVAGTVSYLNKTESLQPRNVVLLPLAALAVPLAFVLGLAGWLVWKRRGSRGRA